MRCMNGDIKNVGKGSQEEELPTRFSRDDFTGATAAQRAANYYGKKKRPVDVEMEKLEKASTPRLMGFTMTGRAV